MRQELPPFPRNTGPATVLELRLVFPVLNRGTGSREHDVVVVGVLARIFPVSRYSMISPGIIEESMRRESASPFG
jgi:hypothetical protein